MAGSKFAMQFSRLCGGCKVLADFPWVWRVRMASSQRIDCGEIAAAYTMALSR